jgi:hypothetical protein
MSGGYRNIGGFFNASVHKRAMQLEFVMSAAAPKLAIAPSVYEYTPWPDCFGHCLADRFGLKPAVQVDKSCQHVSKVSRI